MLFGVCADLCTRFAGNDSPSFVFPTAIATRQSPGSSSNRPAPHTKPSFLVSGAGGSSSGLAQKRGTEDLDFFIGDEAIQANAGAGYGIDYPIKHGIISDWSLMERYIEFVTGILTDFADIGKLVFSSICDVNPKIPIFY